jgi:hypothetical protein
VRKRPGRFSKAWLERHAVRDTDTGCILWTGFVCKYGYVRTTHEGKSGVLLHRIAYESAYGPFDESLKVCHRCDTPRCFNPEHLFLGTQKDNLRDMFAKGRARPRGRTPRGSTTGVVTGATKEWLSRWHSTSYAHQLDDSAMVSVLGVPGASDSHLIPPDRRPKWWTVELPKKSSSVSDRRDAAADLSVVSSSERMRQ